METGNKTLEGLNEGSVELEGTGEEGLVIEEQSFRTADGEGGLEQVEADLEERELTRGESNGTKKPNYEAGQKGGVITLGSIINKSLCSLARISAEGVIITDKQRKVIIDLTKAIGNGLREAVKTDLSHVIGIVLEGGIRELRNHFSDPSIGKRLFGGDDEYVLKSAGQVITLRQEGEHIVAHIREGSIGLEQ